MEVKFSEDFKRFFLLAFTKELILQSMDKDMLKLQALVRARENQKQKIISAEKRFPPIEKKLTPVEKVIEKQIPIRTVQENFAPVPSIMSTMPRRQIGKPAVRKILGRPIQGKRLKPGVRSSLYIPEPSLPSHLEYLKPIPNPNIELDLPKINILLKDQGVKIIECNPDEKVVVMGTMGTRTTGISLTKDDIDGIIDKFSIASKIPVEEGIYRVVVGNFILSAIISEVIGSRFILKKITNQMNRPYQPVQGIPMKRVITKETTIKHYGSPKNNLK